MTSRESAGGRKKSETVIRQIEIDDISAVYHLGEQLFTSEELPILYRTWYPNEVTEHFSYEPDYCFVAEKDERIIGFILGTTMEKEGTAWRRYGYVSWIGVDEDHKRSGLGVRLYRKLEEQLLRDGVRMVIADTQGNNRGAIAFLKGLGFSVRSQHVWLAKTLRPAPKKAADR
jgi:ribosomal protein S18 acetylase RimI-like enzyme